MDAKERDLPFRQIHRKMISILRHLVERELTDQIRSGSVTDDTVGLQLHWSIIEEFGGARQYLSNERNTIVRFHGFDLDIHIHITGAEQQLTRRRSHAADTRQHRLVKRVKNEGSNELTQASDLGLHHRLEQIDSPLDKVSGGFERRIFSKPSDQSLEFLLYIRALRASCQVGLQCRLFDIRGLTIHVID